MTKLKKPFLLLIIANIVMMSFTLYVTRTGIKDFEYVSYSQREKYKSVAMMQMSNAYLRSVDFKKYDGLGMGRFLESTVHDQSELFFIFKWDTSNAFPLVYVGGNKALVSRWQTIKNLKDGYERADYFGIIPKDQTEYIYNEILNCRPSADAKNPSIVKEQTGSKYLVTWVIIPTPLPENARYIYMTFTPTSSIDSAVENIQDKYTVLFALATLLAGLMLVLVPIVISRNNL